MRIKIPRISYFSFSFKLNENKEGVAKKHGLERGYKKVFAGGGCDPQRDYE